MAREFARYLVSTHHDPDWAEMTTIQHDCYMALLSSPDLSWAGVHPYLPARFAALAADLTEKKVTKAWEDLESLNKVIIDKRTSEICVRTFLRHDNVLSKPNIAKAFCLAYERILSPTVKSGVASEVKRLFLDNSERWPNSWKAIEERLPELFAELFQELVPEQFPEPLRGRVA